MEKEEKKKKATPKPRKKIEAAPKVKKVKEEKEEIVATDVTEKKDQVFSAKGYLQAIGRRKQSIAQVRLVRAGKGTITVNGKPAENYFGRKDLLETIYAPLKAIGQADKLDVTAKVSGGGDRGQAESIRLGVARALTLLNPTFRVSLKRLSYLHRDPRVKERKKYGLKKARRAPQWAKR